MQKSTKLWIRVLSLALVVLMLGSMLLACRKKEEGAADTTNGGDVVDPNNSDTAKKNVLDGVRYNGETIRVYGWIPSNILEQVQEFNAGLGVVEQNIYKRLDETKKQLNINVEWKEEMHGTAFIQNAVTANQTGGYDVIACYSTEVTRLMLQGAAKNLLSFDTMDFDEPCWPKNMIDQLTIYDKLYFCTGDISTNLIFMTPCVFVNMDMVNTWHINEKIQQQYGEDNIYDLVREGKWTYDAMFELANGVWRDTDSTNGTRTADDTYGLSTYSTLFCNFYAGAGYTLVNSDEAGVYLSEDYTDVDSIEKLLKDVTDFFDGGFCLRSEAYTVVRDNFAAGLHLFSLAPASHAYLKHYHTDNLNYAALPMPKYTVDQEDYRSWHCANYTNYMVASGSANPQIAASFLQCLAQWSYDTTRIAIFENTMKARFAQGDSDVVKMWEMIVDSQAFDIGRICASSFRRGGSSSGAILIWQFDEKLKASRTDWENVMDAYKDELIELAEQFNTELAALPDT